MNSNVKVDALPVHVLCVPSFYPRYRFGSCWRDKTMPDINRYDHGLRRADPGPQAHFEHHLPAQFQSPSKAPLHPASPPALPRHTSFRVRSMQPYRIGNATPHRRHSGPRGLQSKVIRHPTGFAPCAMRGRPTPEDKSFAIQSNASYCAAAMQCQGARGRRRIHIGTEC